MEITQVPNKEETPIRRPRLFAVTDFHLQHQTQSSSNNLTLVDAVVLAAAERQRHVGAPTSNSVSWQLPRRFPCIPPMTLSGSRHLQPSTSTESTTNDQLLVVNVLDEVLKKLAKDDGDCEDGNNHPNSTSPARPNYSPNRRTMAARDLPFSYSSIQPQQQQQQQ